MLMPRYARYTATAFIAMLCAQARASAIRHDDDIYDMPGAPRARDASVACAVDAAFFQDITMTPFSSVSFTLLSDAARHETYALICRRLFFALFRCYVARRLCHAGRHAPMMSYSLRRQRARCCCRVRCAAMLLLMSLRRCCCLRCV